MSEEITLTIQEKIDTILNSEDLEQLPVGCLPDTFEEEYYFVSYSHLDYKNVYPDILRLQEAGLNMWYDRGMPAGKDWRDVAERHINRFACKGVIFYISENSLKSNAIHLELALVKDSGKDFLTINTVNKPACEIVEEMSKTGVETNEKKIKKIKEILHKDIIFLNIDDDIDKKIDVIKNLRRQPLLNFGEFENIFGKNEFFVKSVNDIDVRHISLSDFQYEVDGIVVDVTKIGPCAFANCRQLESIELPESVNTISNNAFFNCEKLKKINLKNIKSFFKSAFENCRLLDHLEFGEDVFEIDESSFSGCVSLEQVTIPKKIKKIMNYSFSHCDGLKSIELSKVREIGIRAFEECKNLEWIILPDSIERIEDGAFENCYNLKRISIFGDLSIGEYVFSGCGKIEEITTHLSNTFRVSKNCLIDTITGTVIRGSRNYEIPVERNIKTIGDFAFSGCDEKKELIIPKNIRKIGDMSFSQCIGIKSVVFSKGVCEIGSYAFSGCDNLEDITISKSLKRIGAEAFFHCKKLKIITYLGNISDLKKIKIEKSVAPTFPFGAVIHCIDGDIQL